MITGLFCKHIQYSGKYGLSGNGYEVHPKSKEQADAQIEERNKQRY
jgi:hypothetical protein